MTEHHPPGRRRFLTEEEIELWLNVTHGVAPMPGRAPPARPEPKPPVAAPHGRARSSEPAQPKAPGRSAKAAVAPLAPLDRRLRQRLSRGRIAVEAAIDLHGMRQGEAHQALIGFLARAQRDRERLVLVVTGKGKSGPADGLERETGVLRRAVPHWLRSPELRRLVVGFEEAASLHGGAGALYVQLRRAERGAGRPR
ncbi:MAG: Smr/MutS family protein [Methylobacteriaceae bacterium]|nr:Smr/MutS family protein [Methylobacteriaceae bacterium]